MKAQGNWKAWEKGDKRRIYVGDGIYFERGATGLMSQFGLNESEIAFAAELFDSSPNGADFDKWFDVIKSSKVKKTEKKVKVPAAEFAVLFNKHIAEGMTGREAAAMAQLGK